MQVYSSLSGIPFYAPSAGFAPTNSADVSAIASAYQVVSATATQLYAGTAYVTSVNDAPLSASRAGNAANASLANSAWYDGTGRLISALPDSAAVSAIASSYAESAASSKQDTLTFGYDTSDKISSINGSSLAGEGGGLITATGSALNPWYLTSVSSINGFTLSAQFADSADKAVSAGKAYSALYAYSSTNAHEADTVKPSALSAYMTAVSSPSGTVRISVGTAIDCTDSAVVGEYIAGSSGILTGSEAYIKPLSNVPLNIYSRLPTLEYNTQLMLEYGEACTIYFSGDNGESADISYAGLPTSINVPIHSASAIAAYTDNSWITNARLYFTADSVDNSHLVPLAHASALPTYSYDAEDKISAINGSAIAGGGVDSATVSAIASSYAESAMSSKLDESATADFYSTSNPSGFITGVDLSDYATTAYVDSSVSSKLDTTAFNSADFYSTANPSGFIDSAYVESSVSSKADSSALSSYALSADVSGTVDLVSTQSANWGGSALALSAGPGVKLEKIDNTLVASTDETVLFSGSSYGVSFTETLSENITNFEYLGISISNAKNRASYTVYPVSEYPTNNMSVPTLFNKDASYAKGVGLHGMTIVFNKTSADLITCGCWLFNFNDTVGNSDSIYLTKIVGINRTAEA